MLIEGDFILTPRREEIYGVFKCNSNIGKIEFKRYKLGWSDGIILIKDGKETLELDLGDDLDEDRYDETDDKIIIYCEYPEDIIIDRKSMKKVRDY